MRLFARPRRVHFSTTAPVILKGRDLTQTILALTVFDPVAVVNWVRRVRLSGFARVKHPLLYLFGSWRLRHLLPGLGLNKEEIEALLPALTDYFADADKGQTLSAAIEAQGRDLELEISRLKLDEDKAEKERKSKFEALFYAKVVLTEEIMELTERVAASRRVQENRLRLQQGLESLQELVVPIPEGNLAAATPGEQIEVTA